VQRRLSGTVDQVAVSGERACFTRAGRVGVLDLRTGLERTVSTPGVVAASCDVSGAVVAWQERAVADTAVVVLHADGRTRTRVSARGAVATHPRLDGTLVVWSEARAGDGGDIRVHDLADGTTRTVVSAPGAQSAPDVSDGLVVWTDDRAGRGNAEVYLRDLATAVETRVTRDEGWSGNASISAGRIAWEDVRESGRQVYARTLTPPALRSVLELSGDGIALAGRLTETNGIPEVAADVALQVATADGPWHDAGSATTAGDGSYRLLLPDGLGSGRVRVRFAGSHSHPPASSDVVALPARP
jgi:beta propeller repeat protein